MIIDNLSFVARKQEITGELQIKECLRAIDLLDELDGIIHYKLTGLLNDLNQPTLKVQIYGTITTLCQICLNNIELLIDNNRMVQIFKNEAALDAALFGENSNAEDGILADAEFNVFQFIEDELIMSLPLAPKHKVCEAHSYHDESSNPFSVLKKIIN